MSGGKMIELKYRSLMSAAILCVLGATAAYAEGFNIPSGNLETALDSYSKQTGVELIVSGDAVSGVRTKGVKGEFSDEAALARILAGTGFAMQRHSTGAIAIIRDRSAEAIETQINEAAATVPSVSASALETVTVTSSKIGGDVQNIPISITAMSQEQLTATQTAGGPDLVKNVPNLTFSKTNFTGYNIQIRGIGTQAISVTTDPAVAVAFNDVPFLRNHFFEQEFYDVSQVEVLRGPQGTLYGRNATAGVVNVVSAKPADQYEAMASVDVGNYENRRLEGMLNIPIVGDKLDLRVAGEWTKRNGYTFDTTLDQHVDGRDLWSGRVSLGFKPIEKLQATLVWEHFSEDDDRLRSGKTLCTNDPGPTSIDGPDGLVTNIDPSGKAFLSQGCLPRSLYAPAAYAAPVGTTIPFVFASEYVYHQLTYNFDPYGGVQQSRNLRVIGSALQPSYKAKNDTLEFNADYDVTPALTLTSQTGYNKDFLYSTEDFNRFDTVPGIFDWSTNGPVGTDGIYCDPQLGCSNRFVAEDLSQEHAEQFYQEVRLASNFDGPLNFTVGASYLHYRTIEDYFVFSNILTEFLENSENQVFPPKMPHTPFDPVAANACGPVPAEADTNFDHSFFGLGCSYVDPNTLSQINGQGHNYFRSENPYRLHSWAGFGEESQLSSRAGFDTDRRFALDR